MDGWMMYMMVCAGTNDLGSSSADEIITNLKKIHSIALDHSPTTRTVVIAIPQHGQVDLPPTALVCLSTL
jgi:hypothetical protein